MTFRQPDTDPDRPHRALRSGLRRLVPVGLGALALALPAAPVMADQAGAGSSGAVQTGAPASTTTAPAPTATVPAGANGTTAPTGAEGQGGVPPTTTTTTSTTGPSAGSPAPATAAPEAQAQSPQAPSVSRAPAAHRRAHRTVGPAGGVEGKPGAAQVKRAARAAPLPSALTPPGWAGFGSLGAPIGGVPEFFIESFSVPPFLLPIYQAAGTAYGIPWQVLAAINEVETDYGRDLSVSSAGAEGWMQFLPSSWAQYGVDANGAGYEDPYNPADAIFAAARYLAAAGGARRIRAAVFSYNHSQAYVESVMLRAQLLDGTPPELLSAVVDLTESRFPVHAPAHFADGFPTMPESGSGSSGTLVGTTIYSQAQAPVIAVQDGRIVAIGESPTLGRYVSLRDAYGNTYTYAQLGSVAELYPVLKAREDTAVSPRIARSEDGSGPPPPAPSVPASAGVQPHSPLSQSAITSSLAMGAAAGLETASVPTPPPTPPPPPRRRCGRLPRASSAPDPTRSTCTRCAPAWRCSRGQSSAISAAPPKHRNRTCSSRSAPPAPGRR